MSFQIDIEKTLLSKQQNLRKIKSKETRVGRGKVWGLLFSAERGGNEVKRQKVTP